MAEVTQEHADGRPMSARNGSMEPLSSLKNEESWALKWSILAMKVLE